MNYKYLSIGLVIILFIVILYNCYSSYSYKKQFLSGVWESDKSLNESFYLIIPDDQESISFLDMDSTNAVQLPLNTSYFSFFSFGNSYSISVNLDKNELSKISNKLPPNFTMDINILDGSMMITKDSQCYGVFYKNNSMIGKK